MSIDRLLSNYRTLTTCTANFEGARTIVFELNPTLGQKIAAWFGRQPELFRSFVSYQTNHWVDTVRNGQVEWPDSHRLEQLFRGIHSESNWK